MSDLRDFAESLAAIFYFTEKVSLGNRAPKQPLHKLEYDFVRDSSISFGDLPKLDLSSTVQDQVWGCLEELGKLQEMLGHRLGFEEAVVDSLEWPLSEEETEQYITRIERLKSLFTPAIAINQV
jgi:hypothetical protein